MEVEAGAYMQINKANQIKNPERRVPHLMPGMPSFTNRKTVEMETPCFDWKMVQTHFTGIYFKVLKFW